MASCDSRDRISQENNFILCNLDQTNLIESTPFAQQNSGMYSLVFCVLYHVVLRSIVTCSVSLNLELKPTEFPYILVPATFDPDIPNVHTTLFSPYLCNARHHRNSLSASNLTMLRALRSHHVRVIAPHWLESGVVKLLVAVRTTLLGVAIHSSTSR